MNTTDITVNTAIGHTALTCPIVLSLLLRGSQGFILLYVSFWSRFWVSGARDRWHNKCLDAAVLLECVG